ncbi:MAG TPA: hypothetical protein VGT02_08610 [Methylomirabilota bacterium]|jgi:hypothetical protein|nr:hypothetical protein [Methylomirabilota bacterium]
MPRLLVLVLLVALTSLALAAPADAVPSPLDILRTNSQLPPTAPDADFNQPGQSSSWIVSTLHMRGPEKLIATAVALLLLLALVMFAGMLRHVYGGASAPRR